MSLGLAALRSETTIQRVALGVFLALLAVVVFSTLSPIGWRPRTGHVHLERMAAFLLLGASLAAAFPRRRLVTAIVVCLLAGGLELGQMLIPTRHGRLPDAAEKMVGAALGVLIGGLISRFSRTWAPAP